MGKVKDKKTGQRRRDADQYRCSFENEFSASSKLATASGIIS
jgi:hypothetical protein